MEPRTLQFIAESCGGTLKDAGPGTIIRRIATDSRAVQEGDLFIALKGENFDAHDFLEQVFEKGATAAVVEEERQSKVPSGKARVVVGDARKALGSIGARYRQDFPIHAVAVAGSNGKTSTKEIIAAVLAQKFPTVRSDASFNNDVGVPLTLLKIEKEHRAGVFEAGTNHPGELAPLLEMIQPTHGVITSIAREHLEFFKDLNGVIEEEGFLAEAVPAGGKLFLHGDGPGVAEISKRSKAEVVLAGKGDHNHWRMREAELSAEGTTFLVEAPETSYSGVYQTRLLGMHQAVNALFAVAVGKELGLGRAEIQRGLDSCKGAKMRLQSTVVGGVLIVDDSYNANADSMLAALETLDFLPCAGNRIAVLGDMAELGPLAAEAHEEVGRVAADRKVDALIGVGKNSAITAEAANRAGLRNAEALPDTEEALRRLITIVKAGDVVLVKASRSSRLERVVEGLQKYLAEAKQG